MDQPDCNSKVRPNNLNNGGLLLLGFLIFAYLVLRNSAGTIYPVVLADEWLYSSGSRLEAMADAPIPSYIYYMVYKSVNLFGDGFLQAARVINSLIYVLSLPFIYSICRKITSHGVSLFISGLGLLNPFNSYTAYFMPESMYFLFFWVATWFILELRKTAINCMLLGFILGLGMLIKFHAIFLAPAVILFLFGTDLLSWNKLYKNFIYSISFLATLLLTRLMVGFLISGSEGLMLRGRLYENASPTVSQLIARISDVFFSLNGNILACIFVLGPALGILFFSSNKIDTDGNEEYKKIRIWTLTSFLVLLSVVALFTASIAGASEYEKVNRIHMRYYGFMLPLFYILMAHHWNKSDSPNKNYWNIAIQLIITGLIPVAYYLISKQYALGLADCPGIIGTIDNFGFALVVILFNILLLLLFIFRYRYWSKTYLMVVIPIYVLWTSVTVFKLTNKAWSENIYARGGYYARQLLDDDITKLCIIGRDAGGLYAAQFTADSTKIFLITVNEKKELADLNIPPDKEWILVFGDLVELPEYFPTVDLGIARLVNIKRGHTIDFRKSTWPGILISTSGLSFAEPWGTWSVGKQVELVFKDALPLSFQLTLYACAYKCNIGKEFEIKVGSSTEKFILDNDPTRSTTLIISTRKKENRISINIPTPCSPKQLGDSLDERELGIALVELKIEPFE